MAEENFYMSDDGKESRKSVSTESKKSGKLVDNKVEDICSAVSAPLDKPKGINVPLIATLATVTALGVVAIAAVSLEMSFANKKVMEEAQSSIEKNPLMDMIADVKENMARAAALSQNRTSMAKDFTNQMNKFKESLDFLAQKNSDLAELSIKMYRNHEMMNDTMQEMEGKVKQNTQIAGGAMENVIRIKTNQQIMAQRMADGEASINRLAQIVENIENIVPRKDHVAVLIAGGKTAPSRVGGRFGPVGLGGNNEYIAKTEILTVKMNLEGEFSLEHVICSDVPAIGDALSKTQMTTFGDDDSIFIKVGKKGFTFDRNELTWNVAPPVPVPDGEFPVLPWNGGFITFGSEIMLYTSNLNSIVLEGFPPKKKPAKSHRVARINSASFVVTGGSSSDGETLNGAIMGTFIDNTKKVEWTQLKDLSKPRQQHCMYTFQSKLFVLGGTSDGNNFLKTSEYLDLNEDVSQQSWKKGPGFPKTIRGHSCHVSYGNNFVVIIGGECDQAGFLDEVVVMKKDMRFKTQSSEFEVGNRLITKRASHSAIEIRFKAEEDKILRCRGKDQCCTASNPCNDKDGMCTYAGDCRSGLNCGRNNCVWEQIGNRCCTTESSGGFEDIGPPPVPLPVQPPSPPGEPPFAPMIPVGVSPGIGEFPMPGRGRGK